MSVALDSWAVLAWLHGQSPAQQRLDTLLALDAEPPVISWINLAEVHYRVIRDHGASRAVQTTNRLEVELRAELPTRAVTLHAAEIKAEHPIALADCFAAAQAADLDLTLLTGDPELLDRADRLPCRLEDLR